jgi:hypothetical protein
MKPNPCGFNLNFDEFFDLGRLEGAPHFSHFQTFARLQDRNLRFAFGQTGKLFRVTK